MSDDDFYDDEPDGDDGVGIANGMVIVTGVILIAAIYLMWKIAAGQDDVGPLA